MSFSKQGPYEIRHQELLKAVRLCGGVTQLSKLLGLKRSRVSNWINSMYMHIPYEYLLDIANITKISIERLAPGHPKNKGKLSSLEIPIENILLGSPRGLRELTEHRPILIDTSGILISGLLRLERYKASGIKRISVEPIDLEPFLFDPQEIEHVAIRFLLTERVEIALHLEQLFGSRQDPRIGIKDEKIAKIVGFSGIFLHRAKQVYFQGIVELLTALNQNRISIDKAFKIASLSKEQQLKRLESELFKNPRLTKAIQPKSTVEEHCYVQD